jgi:hypothetical protein
MSNPHGFTVHSEPEVELILGSSIEPEEVSWLWRYWLQRGAFNLLAGRSTVGKSTIALSFAAIITSGGVWPDGLAFGDPYKAVFWSGEDGIKDTLLPRFIAAGGEPSNIAFVGGVSDGQKKRAFDPAKDMKALTRAVEKLGDVRLIVADPVALMVKGDSHKNVETRVGLQPFADLCLKTGACGLGLHHLTKNTAGLDPLERVSGSLAFGALPRCVLFGVRYLNNDKEDKRALMRVKATNGPDKGGFDYKLDQRALENWPNIEAQRILWGDYIDRRARDLIAQFEGKVKNAGQRHVVAFLTAMLKNGPQLAAIVIAEAAKLGIPERTLRYVFRNTLGGVAEKAGFRGAYVWELPKEGTP